MIVRLWPAACAVLGSGVAQFARAESAANASGALTGQFISLIMGMAVVLAVIAAAAWLVKRVAPRNYSNAGVLRVIAGAAVGQRERVVVVEIGETWLVLGVTAGSVNALHQLPRQTTAETAAAATREPHQFAAWLKQMLEKRGER
jgi:flagellar protein FliO/FliZ